MRSNRRSRRRAIDGYAVAGRATCPACGGAVPACAGPYWYYCPADAHTYAFPGNGWGIHPGWYSNAALRCIAGRSAGRFNAIVKALARGGELGALRRARRHPAPSRNTYRSHRAERDMARSVVGLRTRQVDAPDR